MYLSKQFSFPRLQLHYPPLIPSSSPSFFVFLFQFLFLFFTFRGNQNHHLPLVMADESEMRMEALKKAYAEIILNTSKEAATRVMAAERKALCFHHDLVSLKEESLRMFLRLKENFNSKITEAEARSFNQQMKIEELEAQLSEAEGIIVDLRYELKEAQEKVEVMRHSQKQPLSEPVLRVEEPIHDNVLNSSALVMGPVSDEKSLSDCETKVASLHPTVQINKCCHTMNSSSLCSKSHLDQFHFGDCDFASIIMENRESELYRNGCTQRVRAFDRNLSNKNLPSPSENHQPVINVQSETPKEQAASGSHSPVRGAHNTKKLTLFAERRDNGHQDNLANITTVHNKEKKRRKPSDELNAHCPKMLKTSGKAPGNVSSSEAHLKTINATVSSGKEPFLVCSSETDQKIMKQIVSASQEQLLQNCDRGKHQTTCSTRRSAQKNSRYREAIAALRGSSHKICTKSYQPTLPTQDRTTPSNVNLQSSKITEAAEERSKNTEFCSTSLSNDLDNAVEIKVNCGDVVTREGEPGREEGNASKNRNSFNEKLHSVSVGAVVVDVQLFDVPISEGFGNTRTQPQTQTQGQAGNDRHLKFTFQRRHKKNVLGKLDGNTVLDGSTGKNGVEKPTNVHGLEKHILKDGLNSEGGGVMQVAHQFISSSGHGS